MAAWKALQKVDHDFGEDNLPELKLADPPTFPPNIKHYRDIAFAYSQIDTDGVDEILTNHLQNSINAHKQLANALQSAYDDIIVLVKSRQGEVGASRTFGQLLADDDHQQSGAAFAELFYRFASDGDFQDKLNEIRANHRSEVGVADEEFHRVANADKDVAKTLTEKYGTQFVDAF